MIIVSELARFVFKFMIEEEIRTFQLTLILDLTVLSAPTPTVSRWLL